ncbi:MAG TPA: DEAD/DEAH box helicase [Pyrinomonadaceae bacterium]|nr:DEAD/DEAH box helicase [Pyrinomonadaceae bacterium]
MQLEEQFEENEGSFNQFELSEALIRAVNDVGYETATPIQLKTIPLLLEGKDIIGQAQTGTGKTAAFALPILNRLDLKQNAVQALVLAPTRELAIQVAEAFHTYAKHIGRVKVLPVYGGQSIFQQIQRLRAGAHVIVGTPGRVMDHLRRETLDFSNLKTVVLDEADEMLRMGFLEDVEWILSHTPEEHQTALFSATMPREIRRIADRYLKNPVNIEIERKTMTVPAIKQFYINVSDGLKLDVLTRLLETDSEPGEAVLIFDRTKIGAAEVTEKLQARGYAAEAMHGDMSQAQRENVIKRLREGKTEIVVATDVAARGLDVERITRVINYDMPSDTEVYVHRIGRTGRAGRTGTAILFVTPRQQRMKREIEKYTGQRIEPMKLPTNADVAERRMALFKERILKTLKDEELELYLSLVEELVEESGCDMAEIAAAAARLAGGDKPLEVKLEPEPEQLARPEGGMVRLFIDVGRNSRVGPADIVGAIANEANVPGRAIGAIDVYDRFTLVDLPSEFANQALKKMADTRIRSHRANVRLATERDVSEERQPAAGKPPKGKREFSNEKPPAAREPRTIKVKKKAKDSKPKESKYAKKLSKRKD